MADYNVIDAINADVAKQKLDLANRLAGRAYASGDFQGAANQLALSGDVQGAQQLTANRQNEQLRGAQMANYQSEAQARNLKAQQEFLAGVAPQLQDAYDKAERSAPGSGRAVLQTLYSGYVAPGLQARGVTGQELDRYGQLAQDPNTFFPTLGAIAKAKVQYHNVGDQLLATDDTGKFLGVYDGKQWKTVRNGDSSEVLGSVGGTGTGIFGAPVGADSSPATNSAVQFGGAPAASPQVSFRTQGGMSGMAANGPPPAPPAPESDTYAAFQFFKGKGYTDAQAAGIVGNLAQESGGRDGTLNPLAHNPQDGAYGIGQWRGNRLAALQQFAQQQGADWRNRDTQLAFVDSELKGPEGAAYAAMQRAGDDPIAQAAAFAGYERPAGWRTGGDPTSISGWSNRSNVARSLYSGAGPNSADAPPVQMASNAAQVPGFNPVFTTRPKPAPAGPVPFSANPARAKQFGIDPSLPGYFDDKGEPHVVKDAAQDDTGSAYTPQALEAMAEQYIASGGKDKPSLYRDKAAQALFYNRVAEIKQAQGITGAGMVDRQSSVRADTASLQQLTKTADNINASEATASKAADFVLQGLAGGGGTKYPLLNKAIIAGKRQTGDPAVDAYIARLGTFTDEYAKVISGGTGSAAATDGVRKDAQRRINEAAAPDQLKSVIDSMKTEMEFRSSSLQSRIDTIHQRISGATSNRSQATGANGVPFTQGQVSAQAAMNARFGRGRGWTNGMTDAQKKAWNTFHAPDYERYGAGGSESAPIPVLSAADYAKVRKNEWYLDSTGSVHQKQTN